MKKLIKKISKAIKSNKDCASESIVTKSCVYFTDKGCMQSKDKEIIALLSGSYYGKSFIAHVFKDYNTKKWVSLILFMSRSLRKDVIFKEYAEAFENMEFGPCAIQDDDQAFKLNESFKDACVSLVDMITVFKVKDRIYDNENIFESKNPNTRFDLRVHSVY